MLMREGEVKLDSIITELPKKGIASRDGSLGRDQLKSREQTGKRAPRCHIKIQQLQ